jgi:beta-glucosidase
MSPVDSLTRAARVRLLSGRDLWRTAAESAVGLDSVWLSDGPHGLRKQIGDTDHLGIAESEPATCYPTAATLASSWDVELLEQVGSALGREARHQGVEVVLGPGLNIKRHPNCGRNFEYFSEDPLLSGRLAAAMVRGIQSQGVGACLKHFAVNNQEAWRLVVDAVVDERTLREIYLTGFEIAVKESSPWTIMAAYNRLNGEYCTDSHRLLTTILRDEWGFDGLVMSDWTATNDRVSGVRAGMDLEMPSSGNSFDADVLAALEKGDLCEDELNRCAQRLVYLAARTAPQQEAAADEIDGWHALARRAAAESSVLLKNDGTLPLARGARIAVVGAFARAPRYQGAGSSMVNPRRLVSALEVLRTRFGNGHEMPFADGYDPETSHLDPAAIEAAVAAAVGADAVLLFAGLPGPCESEGFDREHMRLPEQHDRLIRAVCAANPRTVVVLANGAPVEMPWADAPAAILETWLGGEAGGAAVVDVLCGDVDPGGRLAESFPRRQTDVPADPYFPGMPRQVQYREGVFVGYRYYETAGVAVRYPFGHGLSYTRFELGAARLSATSIATDGETIVTVPVTNTGDRHGAEVVQVYVRRPGSAIARPDKELRGFAKVRLAPGETREVAIPLGPRAFAHYDPRSAGWVVEEGGFEILVGTSVAAIHSTLAITVGSAGTQPATTAIPGWDGVPWRPADDQFAARLGRPIPRPDPLLPFDRTSTFGDLGATWSGRFLQQAVLRIARSETSKMAGGNAALQKMLDRATLEAPLRSMVLVTRGKLTFGILDGMIAALNGRWADAVRCWWRGRG